jgi:hypothetical protein
MAGSQGISQLEVVSKIADRSWLIADSLNDLNPFYYDELRAISYFL